MRSKGKADPGSGPGDGLLRAFAPWRDQSVHMLDVIAEDSDPVVLALLPEGEFGLQEIGMVEGAERNGGQAVELALDRIMPGRAALGAEMMGDAVAAVGVVGPDLRLA